MKLLIILTYLFLSLFILNTWEVSCEKPLTTTDKREEELYTKTFRIGPIEIDPEAHLGHFAMNTGHPQFEDGTPAAMSRFQVRLVDAKDAERSYSSNELYLHHALMVDMLEGHDDFIRRNDCDDNDMVWFAASGAEFTPLVLRSPYAYVIEKESRVGCAWEVMNRLDEVVNFYIEYTMEYSRFDARQTKAVTPMFLDVTACKEGDFDLPGDGGEYTKSRVYRTWWEGEIVYAGGHLHAGGIDVTMFETEPENLGEPDEDQDQLVFRSEAVEENDLIVQMTYDAEMARHVTVGTHLRIDARYRNNEPREDVMGIMFLYAVVERDAHKFPITVDAHPTHDDQASYWLWVVLACNIVFLLLSVGVIVGTTYLRWDDIELNMV